MSSVSAALQVPAATAAAESAITVAPELATSLGGSALEALQAPASFFSLQPSSFHPALTDVVTSFPPANDGILALASGLLPLAGSWQQDVAATLFTLLGSVAWVRVFDELARRNVLEQKLSRKIVHITTGLLFMLSWPLFSFNPAARFLAVAVPVANAVRIVLLGTGITKNEGVVKSISREGSAR
ncbi:hypothetical protein CLOM_g13703 [Closterium sp. NIES-68]|nr:hypothetical protein CLOM_g13703 [Closterium sp. NIES-68]GJP73492.1 hypothetical protein CLOP_g4197 [Closterium sp. NIES-67]